MKRLSKSVMVVLGAISLGGIALAVTIPEGGVTSNKTQELLTAASENSGNTYGKDSSNLGFQLMPYEDTLVFGGPTPVFCFNLEANGVDTTYYSDTLELTFRTIGNLTASGTTLQFACDSGIVLISGDTLETHDFTEEDTFTSTFELCFPGTGWYWINFDVNKEQSFSGWWEQDTISNLNLFAYIHAYGDSLQVTWYHAPVGFLGAQNPVDTSWLLGGEKLTSGSISVSGCLTYKHGDDTLPAEGIQVELAWIDNNNQSVKRMGWTGNSGRFTFNDVTPSMNCEFRVHYNSLGARWWDYAWDDLWIGGIDLEDCGVFLLVYKFTTGDENTAIDSTDLYTATTYNKNTPGIRLHILSLATIAWQFCTNEVPGINPGIVRISEEFRFNDRYIK